MSANNLPGHQVMSTMRSVANDFVVKGGELDLIAGKTRVTPAAIRDWLARLRLLEGVPFNNLVADSELLPIESIRFFYCDRQWTDALVEGALSVGTVNTADRAQLESLYPAIRGEIDEQERLVRLPGSEAVQVGKAGQITGFLLRSRAVSGWPGLQVRAYRKEIGDDEAIVAESHPDRIKLLRLERLAPAVLLALFDGVPRIVHIEEPRSGIQFGVKLQSQGGNSFKATVRGRDVLTATDVKPNLSIPVSFRPGSPGVLDLRATRNKFLGAAATHMNDDTQVDSAEFALQMIRFPYRQVFGDLPQSNFDWSRVLRPTIGYDIAGLTDSFSKVSTNASD
jgi:hypothetical protein